MKSHTGLKFIRSELTWSKLFKSELRVKSNVCKRYGEFTINSIKKEIAKMESTSIFCPIFDADFIQPFHMLEWA